MSEFSYHPSYKKIPSDPFSSTYTRRQSQPTQYYYNNTQVENRSSSYHAFQPQLQQKKIFGFQLFINNQILKELQPIESWFKGSMDEHELESIKFNPDLGIPDLNGRNIQIFDNDMDKKYQCSKSLLHDVYQVFKKIKKQPFSIIIFVPQGMVSLLIGTKGHQINKIMRQSYTKIVVNQPINKMTYRTAKIQGQYSDIAKACKMIYQILQQKSAIAYAIEKQPSQFDYTKSKIKTKILFPYQIMKYLTKKKQYFLDKIQEQTKCSISIETDRRNHLIRQDQEILIINGKLEDVQAYIVMLINIVHPILSQERKNVDYTLKLLIPSNYVTKLIGQKGYMIKDIIQRSGGAQIKILSDREAQRDTKQCIISINGTIQNKIDASCFILEQIECFKNGGPILQSGKSINQNLVQQFKNSIPIHLQAQKPTNEMEIQNNQNTQNSTNMPPTIQQNVTYSVPNQSSPPIKNFASTLPSKFQDNQKSEQQGLIEADSFEEQKRISQNQHHNQSDKKQKIFAQSQKSSSISNRSRSRQKKRQKRTEQKKRKRSKSRSSSIQFKFDREYVQVKLIIPKKLAQDYRQLQYIQGIGKSKIIPCDQKSIDLIGEGVIIIKGCMKDNSKTIKLLQKRITRYRNN